MTDDIYLDFYNKLLTTKIDFEIFREYMRLFSKFLVQTNEDYKYNTTFLEQYLNEFELFDKKLREKTEIYLSIVKALLENKTYMEVKIDNMFWVKLYQNNEFERQFIGIEKSKLESNSVTIKITFSDESIFSRQYDTNQEFLEILKVEVKHFIKAHEKKG